MGRTAHHLSTRQIESLSTEFHTTGHHLRLRCIEPSYWAQKIIGSPEYVLENQSPVWTIAVTHSNSRLGPVKGGCVVQEMPIQSGLAKIDGCPIQAGASGPSEIRASRRSPSYAVRQPYDIQQGTRYKSCPGNFVRARSGVHDHRRCSIYPRIHRRLPAQWPRLKSLHRRSARRIPPCDGCGPTCLRSGG